MIYLPQSIYGRCSSSISCNAVTYNYNRSFVTGYGNNSDSEYYSYNKVYGKTASTTGNIYGIYDMSGGAEEYVMGVYWDGTNLWSGYSQTNSQHSGFCGFLYSTNSYYSGGVAYPSNSKYYNLYTNTGTSESPVSDYNKSKQHALTETSGWYGSSTKFFVIKGCWFRRSGKLNYGSIFYYHSSYGDSSTDYGSRSALTIN